MIVKPAAPVFLARSCCPVCSSPDIKDHFAFDGLRTAICRACDFMFTRDIMAAEALRDSYAEGYADQGHLDGQRVNATVNLKALQSFVPDLAGKSILDIGSGFGFLLAQARTSGAASVLGVELSIAERKYADETLGVETLARLDDIPGDARFDIITLFEVIEHVPEPGVFLKQAQEYLKPGGSLIIGTDNFESAVVRILGRGFPKWIPNEHISLFTPATLAAVIKQAGNLKIAGMRSYTPWELVVRQVAFQLSGGRKGASTFSLAAALDYSAHGRAYRFFKFRLAMNKIWFQRTSRINAEGEIMYFHAMRPAP